jgi:hypothetical protein
MKLSNGHLFIYFTITFLFFPLKPGLYAQAKIKGNKEVKTEQTPVEPFHTISIGNELEVLFIKSTAPSVTIEADSNLHPIINFQVKDSVLNFQINKIVRRSKQFKAIVRYTNNLEHIILNGSVDVEAENSIELKTLDLTLHDDSKIDAKIVSDNFRLENNNETSIKLTTNCILNLECKIAHLELKNNSNNIIEINAEELEVNTYDKAELDIEGFSYKLNVDSTNSSEINGENLLTNISNIKLSKKADAIIQATDTITVDASGNTKLELYGQPKILVKNLSGTSSIIKKEH